MCQWEWVSPRKYVQNCCSRALPHLTSQVSFPSSQKWVLWVVRKRQSGLGLTGQQEQEEKWADPGAFQLPSHLTQMLGRFLSDDTTALEKRCQDAELWQEPQGTPSVTSLVPVCMEHTHGLLEPTATL
jgi:hypothetical protein